MEKLYEDYKEEDYERLVEMVEKEHPFDVFMRVQSIYMELEEYSGKCSKEDRDFLVGYMKGGSMNEDEIDDYELVRSHHPELNLPECDF